MATEHDLDENAAVAAAAAAAAESSRGHSA